MRMDPALLAGLLGRTHLFADFSREELAVFVPHLELESYGAGGRIVQDGEDDDAWYVVLQGEVSVTKGGPEGVHELALLERGDSFGELALIDQAPRSADVSALTEVLVARLTREAFVQLSVAGHPAATRLLWGLASVMCQRQRQLTQLLVDLVETPQAESDIELRALAMLLHTRLAESDLEEG